MSTKQNNRSGFTLIELLTVIGILAVLAVVVFYFLNPAQLIKQGQDGNRVAAIGTLNKAISLYYSDAITAPSTLYMGSSSVLYLSVPDPTATSTAGTNCAGVGLTSNGSSTYHCPASSTYQKTDGTGWIPINFNSYSAGTVIPNLPVDPINNATSGEYYIYVTNGTSYEVMANPASAKNASSSDFTQGSNTSLLTNFPTSGGSTQNIWIADYNNSTVQEFSATGTYLGQLGTAGIAHGKWNNPSAIAMDASGDMYVSTKYGALHGDDEVQEMNSGGSYVASYFLDACDGGNYPGVQNMVIDPSGNVWIANYSAASSHGFGQPAAYACVGEMSATGTGLQTFGSADDPGSYLQDATALAITSGGNIWVADNQNDNVQEFDSAGTYITQFGTAGSSNGEFESPSAVVIDGSGNIWVADATIGNVQEFSSSGSYITQFGTKGTSTGQLEDPDAMAIDANGNIWVVDAGNKKVDEFTSSGSYVSSFGTTGSSAGQFENPVAIVIR